METPTYNNSWSQDDYDHVKEHTSDEFDFVGPGGHSEISLKFGLGNQIEVKELEKKSNQLKEELENARMNVSKVVVRAGYSGSISARLLIVVYFEEKVYQD